MDLEYYEYKNFCFGGKTVSDEALAYSLIRGTYSSQHIYASSALSCIAPLPTPFLRGGRTVKVRTGQSTAGPRPASVFPVDSDHQYHVRGNRS